jgi:hypothetical protein
MQSMALPFTWWILGTCLLASAYLKFENKVIRLLLSASVLVLVFRQPVRFVLAGQTAMLQLGLFVLLFVGFGVDMVFVAVTRALIRWAAEMRRSLKVAAVVMLNLLLAVTLTSLLWVPDPVPIQIAMLRFVCFTNIFDAILALFFVFLALFLLIHRALWPLLSRTLFRMQDIGTKGRRAILTAVGIALLGSAAFGEKFPELLNEIVKAFGG